MKEAKIKVLALLPMELPKEIELDNTLEAMQNEKCVKDEPHSEFTKEEQQEFLNLLNRITLEQREALKKVLKSFI